MFALFIASAASAYQKTPVSRTKLELINAIAVHAPSDRADDALALIGLIQSLSADEIIALLADFSWDKIGGGQVAP